MDKGFEAIKEEDDVEHENTGPRHVRLEPRLEIEVIAADTLQGQGLVKPDVADANADPRNEATQGYRHCQSAEED